MQRYVYGSVRSPFWHKIKVFFLTIFWLIFFILLITGIFGAIKAHEYLKDIPTLDKRVETKIAPSTTFLDSHNNVLYPTKKPSFVPTTQDNLSKNFQDALLSIEDRNFYQENGINYIRLIKALYNNITSKDNHIQGASTIPQQLIKLTYYSTQRKDQTVKRKFQEILLAKKLIKKYSKKEILTFYCNKVYLGNNIYGMNSAAHYYFGKDLNNLSKDQCAVLAGLVQAPSAYEPYHHPSACKTRRNQVIRAMYANKKISKKTEQKLLKEPLTHGLISYETHLSEDRAALEQEQKYGSFLSTIKSQLDSYPELLNKNRPGNLTIKTTLDMNIQDHVNEIIEHQKFPSKKMQVAVSVLDNKTGDILAVSGGRYLNESNGFNRALSMRRSSGSTIKPLLDYAPAFELQDIQPFSMVNDTRYTYPDSEEEVHDFDDQHLGRMTVRSALVQSRNIPAVKLFVANGIDKMQQLSDMLGFNQKIYASSAIGVMTSPLQLASAYTVFPNNGTQVRYNAIKQLKFKNRTTSVSSIRQAVFSPQTAFITTDIMRDVFKGQGTAKKAYIKDIDQAGKTGTTGYAHDSNRPKDAISDAWMAGFTKKYTVVVWCGYDDPNDLHNYLKTSDSLITLDIYRQIMLFLNDRSSLEQPKGIKRIGTYYYKLSQTKDIPFMEANQEELVSSHNPLSTTEVTELLRK